MKKIFTLIAVAAMTLAANAQKTWDFTATPADVVTALDAKVTAGDWKFADPRYHNAVDVPGETDLGTYLGYAAWEGLKVSAKNGGAIGISSGTGRLRINKDMYMQINASNAYFILTGLKAGDEITFKATSANATDARTATLTNATVKESGEASFSVAGSESGVTEATLVVTADGDVTLTQSSGLNVSYIGVTSSTAITNVNANDNAKAAPAKVIKGGKLYIGNYNAAGQQVK